MLLSPGRHVVGYRESQSCPPPGEQTTIQAWGHRGFHGESDFWACVIMVDAKVVRLNTVIGGVELWWKPKRLCQISFSLGKMWLMQSISLPKSALANLYVFWTRKHQHSVIYCLISHWIQMKNTRGNIPYNLCRSFLEERKTPWCHFGKTRLLT